MIVRRLKRVVRRWLQTTGVKMYPVVLMYHRVAAPAADPWGLSVAPDHFAEQIEALTRTYQVVSLEDLFASKASRTRRPLAVVTFDDGYVDNLTRALPVLEKHDCPATVFVATGMIGSAEPFWWDSVATLILESPSLPSAVTVPGPNGTFQVDSTDRKQLHETVWSTFRLAPAEDRPGLIANLRDQIEAPATCAPDDRAMTASELRRLSSSRLVSIGAHTVTHPSLTSLPAAAQRAEISTSRETLEALLERPVHSFSYPFGDHDPVTIEAAGQAGIRHAVTVEGRPVTSSSEALAIPRINIGDWSGETLLRKLRHA